MEQIGGNNTVFRIACLLFLEFFFFFLLLFFDRSLFLYVSQFAKGILFLQRDQNK